MQDTSDTVLAKTSQEKLWCYEELLSWNIAFTDDDDEVAAGLVSEAVLEYHLDEQAGVRGDTEREEHPQEDAVGHPVSYTHLTLPTILRV